MSPGELRDAEANAQIRLTAQGLVAKPPKARSRLELTSKGKKAAAGLLGLKAWPAKDPSWAKLVVIALAGRALGLTAMDTEKLTRVDALRREILRRFAQKEVGSRRLVADEVRLASESVGAVCNDKIDLQRRLALRGAEVLALPDDVAAFAGEVLRLARQLRTGRVGRDLVFVNHAWKAYAQAHPEDQLNLDAFKERLREAWRARQMPLAIANVLEPKWLSDVMESRIDDGRQEWHVIDLAAA